MADTTNITQPDIAAALGKSTRKPKASKLPKPPKPPKAIKVESNKRSATTIAGQAVVWLVCLAVGGGSLVPLSQLVQQEVNTLMLVQADDAGVTDALEKDWLKAAPPSYLEALSELSLGLPKPDVNSAYSAVQHATKEDPSRAHAWANLAYLEYQKAKTVNPTVLDALTKSMDACPLCSDELIRWRFNFVLANWNAMPEQLRRRAFEQADLLRWYGSNGEFLADMRARATAAGIPFDAYRTAVNTPVRSWDLGPAPQAQLASPAAPRAPNS